MSQPISITTLVEGKSKAAAALSRCLHELDCPHGFIGGFAWSLLGSTRSTEMNILIDARTLDIQSVRARLVEMDARFAIAGLKLYFVQEPVEGLKGEALVRAAKNNVLIETLQAGMLGLPTAAEPVLVIQHESGPIPILHPSILILTKLSRWYHTHESTRPKTIARAAADQHDIAFVLAWLAKNNLQIAFEKYQGRPREKLLPYVRRFRAVCADDTAVMGNLEKTLAPEDWRLVLAEPEPSE